MKEITFSKSANTAFASLADVYKSKAQLLLSQVAESSGKLAYVNFKRILPNYGKDLYVARINEKIRMIIRVEDKVEVVDIVNHDLFNRYKF